MAIKIAVQCGHGTMTNGAWDPGCVYGKYTEAGLMLKITKAAVKYLRGAGITVISDSDKDNNKNMVADVAWANREEVKLYVSIHCDYSGAPSGVMPLYVSERGKKLAKALHDSIKSGMKMKSRGVQRRKDLFELNATDMAACILETGSIKNDLGIIRDNYDEYGKCIAKGLCNYLGVEFKEGAAPANQNGSTPKQLYRVRASWKDSKSQVGAYSELANAKKKADETGLNVYDGNGSNVYSGKKTDEIYRVRKSWNDHESQVGAFKDLNNAKKKCDQYAGYHVFNNAGAIVYSSAAKKPTSVEKFLTQLESIETYMRKNHFSYSNKGADLATTWADAKKKKKTNCATYVSWALQEAGLLPKTDLFYCNKGRVNNHRGNPASHLKTVATITKVNKTPKAAGLKKGDICGYTTHTQVFAGWDSNGAPLWYTMGGSDIGKNLPRVRSDYSNRKIEIVIRLK